MVTPRASSSKIRYVVCVNNDCNTVSLEKRKIYKTLPDPDAAAHGLIRVIDESGEDYLFPTQWFVPITVSPTMARALASAV